MRRRAGLNFFRNSTTLLTQISFLINVTDDVKININNKLKAVECKICISKWMGPWDWSSWELVVRRFKLNWFLSIITITNESNTITFCWVQYRKSGSLACLTFLNIFCFTKMKEKLKSIRITPDKSLHFDENSTSHRFTPFKPSTLYYGCYRGRKLRTLDSLLFYFFLLNWTYALYIHLFRLITVMVIPLHHQILIKRLQEPEDKCISINLNNISIKYHFNYVLWQ